MIFSFILIFSTLQTVLQVSKIAIQTDTFIGQLVHKVEVTQFYSVKEVTECLESLWAYIQNLLNHIVLLFSKTPENQIELVQKWQWNGRECIITVIVITDFSENRHTMSSKMTKMHSVVILILYIFL